MCLIYTYKILYFSVSFDSFFTSFTWKQKYRYTIGTILLYQRIFPLVYCRSFPNVLTVLPILSYSYVILHLHFNILNRPSVNKFSKAIVTWKVSFSILCSIKQGEDMIFFNSLWKWMLLKTSIMHWALIWQLYNKLQLLKDGSLPIILTYSCWLFTKSCMSWLAYIYL